LDKFLRNSLLIILIIPLAILLIDLGIVPMTFLVFFIVIGVVLLGLFDVFRKSMMRYKVLNRYEEPDPLICKRVVKEGYNGKEYIITGTPEETFGSVCRTQWQFEKISQRSSWIIVDERGNDITNSILLSYDSIAVLVDTYDREYLQPDAPSSLASEFTSIDQGTEYLDD